jgi:hypothetical protein
VAIAAPVSVKLTHNSPAELAGILSRPFRLRSIVASSPTKGNAPLLRRDVRRRLADANDGMIELEKWSEQGIH